MEMATNMMVNELTHGQELVRQLEAQLSSASSVELCRSLAQEILTTIDKVISIAKNSCPNSPQLVGSPRSEDDSEMPFHTHDRKMGIKKRKTQPKSTSQMRLGSGPGAEGPLEDGHSWRKYGQKKILGAIHPRGYYRCTYRTSQGCPAMKQVQRTDDQQSLYEVTYRGTHTCQRKSTSFGTSGIPLPTLENNNNNHNQHLLLSFQTNLKVETEDLDMKLIQEPSPAFSFPSTPIENSCFKSNFNYSAFTSPTTSESNNYFSASPCGISSYGGQTDFTDIVSGETSKAEDLWMSGGYG
nr:WRKY30 [Hemerocallis fulva]